MNEASDDDSYIEELEEDLRCAAIAGQLALGREAAARVALQHANARREDVEAECARVEAALRRANERGGELGAALAAAETEVREMSECLGERRQRANRDQVALHAAECDIDVLRRRIAALEELRQPPLRTTLVPGAFAAERALAPPPLRRVPPEPHSPSTSAADVATEGAEMVAQRAQIATLTAALAASAAALREARAEAAAERRSGVARLAREQRARIGVREELARAAAAEQASSARASASVPPAPVGRGALLLCKLRAGTISQEEYDHLAPLVRYDAWHEAQQQRAPAVPRNLLLHCLTSIRVARAVVVGTPPFAQFEVRVCVAPRGGGGSGSVSASGSASPCVFEWTVRRRFSEFRMLHVQLRSRCAAARDLELVPQVRTYRALRTQTTVTLGSRAPLTSSMISPPSSRAAASIAQSRRPSWSSAAPHSTPTRAHC